ncbi:intraflagellar transport protein 27 homolog [Amphibalanus amphitrite]|uniref:intraflagellar transport protein 27 homolog n=1 Tax=Amphibalanus amphitrite TaxID=1232801 RepID=UPI001C90E696|nr:intraflagellar transport protein 27 homolog [Amphibalanus amphitrite]XP_043204518.1 intraflagellar transport protein 27 homolog [Amphibalanus amphitrite]
MSLPNVVRGRCVVVGDSTAGKTALVQVFLSDGSDFPKNYNMTFTVELHQKQVRIPDTAESVELFIYDCSGKDIYRDVLQSVLNPNLAIIVYDVTNEKSFQAASEWHKFIRETKKDKTTLPGVLMGCKTDLTERRLISPKEGNDLANKLGFVYMECSAKDNQNIDDAFFYLANEWHKMYSNGVNATLNAA